MREGRKESKQSIVLLCSFLQDWHDKNIAFCNILSHITAFSAKRQGPEHWDIPARASCVSGRLFAPYRLSNVEEV